MTDLVNVPVGSVGAVKLTFEGGKLQLAAIVSVTVDDVLVMVEDAIAGDIDNKVIDGLRAILAKA